MKTEHFDRFAKVADAMDAVERENPGSRAMKELRARWNELLTDGPHTFSETELSALTNPSAGDDSGDNSPAPPHP